jgi:hypothetical protein
MEGNYWMNFKEQINFNAFKITVVLSQWFIIIIYGRSYLTTYYDSLFKELGIKSALELGNNIFGRWILDRMHKQGLWLSK